MNNNGAMVNVAPMHEQQWCNGERGTHVAPMLWRSGAVYGIIVGRGFIEMVVPSPAPILLIAHPGHELLLHGWLQKEHPVVIAITDGSGSSGTDRTAYSRSLIEAAGSTCSATFGVLSDRGCYDCLLEQRYVVFKNWRSKISDEIVRQRSQVVVCDPLELYNPMHDLANALGHSAARAATAELGCRVDVLSYQIVRPHPGVVAARVSLSSEALDLKRSAARGYLPLAAEVEAHEDLLDATTETLFRDEEFAWPEGCTEPANYEVTGRDRIRSGLYSELITYAGHVAPVARKLLGRSGSAVNTQ